MCGARHRLAGVFGGILRQVLEFEPEHGSALPRDEQRPSVCLGDCCCLRTGRNYTKNGFAAAGAEAHCAHCGRFLPSAKRVNRLSAGRLGRALSY